MNSTTWIPMLCTRCGSTWNSLRGYAPHMRRPSTNPTRLVDCDPRNGWSREELAERATWFRAPAAVRWRRSRYLGIDGWIRYGTPVAIAFVHQSQPRWRRWAVPVDWKTRALAAEAERNRLRTRVSELETELAEVIRALPADSE